MQGHLESIRPTLGGPVISESFSLAATQSARTLFLIALRCAPWVVATHLNRLGRFIAAFESGPVVIRQGVSLKSGEP